MLGWNGVTENQIGSTDRLSGSPRQTVVDALYAQLRYTAKASE